MDKRKMIVLIILHLLLAVYSISGILSKMAAKTDFLGIDFCLYYCGILILLGVYAIVWQQIIKELPLTVAFANRAVTVIWGVIWGALFFSETITIGQLFGILLIIVGIILYSIEIGEKKKCQN